MSAVRGSWERRRRGSGIPWRSPLLEPRRSGLGAVPRPYFRGLHRAAVWLVVLGLMGLVYGFRAELGDILGLPLGDSTVHTETASEDDAARWRA